MSVIGQLRLSKSRFYSSLLLSSPFSSAKNAKLVGEKRTQELALLNKSGWNMKKGDRDAIEKTFIFDNFVDAFGFMSKVAIVAEKMDHHPEWFNVYNRVEVVLTTHDFKALSNYDIELARKMDNLAKK